MSEYYHITLTAKFSRLDNLLNDVENLASGCYKIISILKLTDTPDDDPKMGVVVKFRITEVTFDVEEIKKNWDTNGKT